MRLIPPKTKRARQRLCAQLTASLPAEVRQRYRVAIVKGGFGWHAKPVRFGPLSDSELCRRRYHVARRCSQEELWGPGS